MPAEWGALTTAPTITYKGARVGDARRRHRTYLLTGGNILYLFIDDGGNCAALWENGRPLSHHPSGGGRDRDARGRAERA